MLLVTASVDQKSESIRIVDIAFSQVPRWYITGGEKTLLLKWSRHDNP